MKRWSPSLFALGLLGAVVSGTAQAAVIATPVGSPTFVPTDFHLFAAPVGTSDTGFAEVLQTVQSILPPPNHGLNPVLGIGPGAPHAGPYDQEIGQGVAASGFAESTSFTTAQFSGGTGVYLAFMVIPGAGSPTGSSPDFASGPILPNGIFPLTFAPETFTNGVLNDASAPFQVPAIDQVPGFESDAGHSHIPLFTVDNVDLGAQPITGAYEYRISLTDAAGNGYQIIAPFQVQAVPEPSTWALAGLGCVVVGGLALRRRHEAVAA